MIRRGVTLLALVCALCLGAPLLAEAASGGTPAQAISDCNDHGTLTKSYSPSTLRAALAQMPVDVKEYTDCYDVIENQLFKELGKSAPGAATPSSSSSGGSSFLPTWLIIVIVVLALAAITFGAMALRRRSAGPGDPPPPGGPPPPAGPSEPEHPGGPPASGP